MSSLLPDDVRGLADAPYGLQDAIVAALHFLRYEELPKEDQPPKKIWLDGEQLEAWWAEVERRRKAKYGIDGEKEIDGPAEHNEAAKELLI